MWIIFQERFQTKDYNKLARIFERHGVGKLRYSHVIITKVVIEKYCLGKTWRGISNKYGINHSTLYHICNKLLFRDIIIEVLEYCLSRNIIAHYTENFEKILNEKEAKIQLQSLVIKKSL